MGSFSVESKKQSGYSNSLEASYKVIPTEIDQK